MSLIYRFKKEKAEDGGYLIRPRILVLLSGDKLSIEVPALIDSGCDIIVIPEGMVRAIGLDMGGKKSKLCANFDCVVKSENRIILKKVSEKTY